MSFAAHGSRHAACGRAPHHEEEFLASYVAFAASSTTGRTSAAASISHSRSRSSAARAAPSTGSTSSSNLAFRPGVVERHDARAERLVGLADELSARRRHRDARRAELRIEPVDLGRRADMQQAGDPLERRIAPRLVGEMLSS